MDTMLDVAGIVRRAKEAIGVTKDNELAAFLGVSRATVSNWVARNSIDFPLLLDKLKDEVDYNWLLLGKGQKKHQPRFCDSRLAEGEVELIHNPKTQDAMDDRNVTLYDVTAAANLKTLFTNKNQYALGTIQIPNVPRCDGAIYVSGDSMYPLLKSGDIVGYKEISDFSNLINLRGVVRHQRWRIPDCQICKPFGQRRLPEAGQLQSASRAHGYSICQHQCYGNCEVLYQKTHDAVGSDRWTSR